MCCTIILEGEVWELDPSSKPGDLWVRGIIDIQKTATGEIRQCEDSLGVNEDHVSTFMWEDGNYSCDCNRYLFFQREKDEEMEEDYPCGDSAYSVRIRNPHAGTVFYEETDFRSK